VICAFLILPLLGAMLVDFFPRASRATAAIAFALANLVVGIVFWLSGRYLTETMNLSWFTQLGVNFNIGFDGSSLLLALVVAFMTLLALIHAASRDDIEPTSGFYALVLAMSTGLIGIFAARDLILFYVFFEATLIPSLFMLGRFGRANRNRAVNKMALYTLFGGLLMLAAILGVKYISGASSFALADVLAAVKARPLPIDVQTWLLLGFLAAFAVKTPLFPFHNWLPDFHTENHPSGVADLMGTLYKVGGYGLFRFALPLFPDAASNLQPVLMFLAAFTAIYAAWIAFSVPDWKRLLAYAGLSHMGLVALGMFSLHPIGMTGAIILLAFQGVYMGGLFLLTGMVQERITKLEVGLDPEKAIDRGLEIGSIRGLAASAPALAGVALTIWFASIGVPGLAGFVGEFSVFLGAYQANPWMTALAVATVIAAAAMALRAYQKTWLEEARHVVPEVRAREWWVLAPILAVVIFFGIFTAPVLNLLKPSIEANSKHIAVTNITSSTTSQTPVLAGRTR
jgi:NADH-quinone oxidoreductase subunit M